MIRYLLIDPVKTGDALEGYALPTLSIPRWTFRASLGWLENPGTTSIDVKVQQAPTGHDDEWSDLVDFGTLNTAAISTMRTFDVDEADADVGFLSASMKRIRAISENPVAGEHVLSVEAEATIFDVNDNTTLRYLPKSVQDWNEGLERAIEQAQEAVRSHLGAAESYIGRLDAYADDPDFFPALRAAIAAQVGLVAEREQASAKERKGLPTFSPNAAALLRPYREAESLYWRHR